MGTDTSHHGEVSGKWSDLDGRTLAVLLLDGEGDDHHVVWGEVRLEHDAVVLQDAVGAHTMTLLDDWLARIEPSPPELRERLLEGAEFWLRLSVGPLPSDADSGEFMFTGLRLPPDTRS
jgi:hypothetical protein